MENDSNPLRGEEIVPPLEGRGTDELFPTHCQTQYQTQYQTKMSGWATEYFSNPPPEFCIRFVIMKMKTKMKSEYKIFLKPNTEKFQPIFMKTSLPLPQRGREPPLRGGLTKNLTDILSDVLSDILSDVFVLYSTFTFHFRRGGHQIFLKPTPEFCIRFMKMKNENQNENHF